MGVRSIPVDLFNPGQVFACLGFWEAVTRLAGPAQGRFDWEAGAQARFHLDCPSVEDPILEVLAFLDHERLTLRTRPPLGSELNTQKWDIGSASPSHAVYPAPEPQSPATLSVELKDRDGRTLVFDHWLDGSSRDTMKFWAGSGGYPGAALLRDALSLIREMRPRPTEDPFNASAPQSSAFRFDWRRDYVPIDVGFSPNDQGIVVMVGYPIVEVLAAYGLCCARPRRKDRLNYTYGVIGAGDVPLAFHRLALGATIIPFPMRIFRMQLDWPGQEGQARCITQVSEVTP